MNKIRSILVIVDPTASEHPCVQKAALLASAFDARIELYVCDTKAAREARLLAERKKDPARLLDVNLKPMLESLAQPLRAKGLDVSTDCEFSDSLAHGLLDRALRTCAELIIKDTHHHSLVKRTLISNTDWQLIRGTPVPLLLTKQKPWSSVPTVLAAVDPGHVNDKPAALDHEILQWGQAISSRFSGSLHVAHAYVPLSVAATAADVLAPMASTLTPEAMEYEDKEKRKELRALTRNYDIPEDNIHLDLGVPSDMLPRKAEELGADLVVMGAIARNGLKRIFIGSTAERVLEHLPCDVLVVKPLNFRDVLPGL